MLISESAINVKNVKEYLWGGYFVFFSMQNAMPDTTKHSVLPPQTHCLTMSNMLFDNINTCISPINRLYMTLSPWLSDNYRNMQNTRVFCPSDFRNGFRGHSRDSKRAKFDYTFQRHRGTENEPRADFDIGCDTWLYVGKIILIRQKYEYMKQK